MKTILGIAAFFIMTFGMNVGSVSAGIFTKEGVITHYVREQKEKQKLIKELTPSVDKELSYLDFLYYKLLKNGDASIAVLGSSVTKGSGASDYAYSWAGRLEQKIQSLTPEFRTVEVKNFGYSGYTSRDLLKHKIVVKQIIKENPDLIIFETALLNDHTRNIPFMETEHNLEMVYTSLQNALPRSKIIVITPNPSTKKGGQINHVGLTYEDYVRKTVEVCRFHGWGYVDIHAGIEAKRKQAGISLDATLADGVHPNDTGYQYWHDVLFHYLAQKQKHL